MQLASVKKCSSCKIKHNEAIQGENENETIEVKFQVEVLLVERKWSPTILIIS